MLYGVPRKEKYVFFFLFRALVRFGMLRLLPLRTEKELLPPAGLRISHIKDLIKVEQIWLQLDGYGYKEYLYKKDHIGD